MLAAAGMCALLAWVGGCTTVEGPRVLTIHAPDYNAAFDAALDSAQAHGLRPVVTDRGTGIIETDARTSGSMLEPWRTDNSGFAQMVGNTINFERRRMRVEFVPADFTLPAPDPGAQVVGAALPGTTKAESRFDLLHHEGPIEIRAWVYVEREFRANQQIGSWTQRQTRYAGDPLDRQAPGDLTTIAEGTWTPIGRDEAYERTVMADIQRRLAAPQPMPPHVP